MYDSVNERFLNNSIGGRCRLKPVFSKRKNRLADHAFAALMALPACLLYAVFFVWPAVQSIQVSTYEWSGFNTDKIKIVGLKNYHDLMYDVMFRRAFANNLRMIVYGGVVVVVLGLLFAMILVDHETRLGRVLRSLVFFPYSISIVAIGIAWTFVFNPQFGLLNTLLVRMGFTSFEYYAWLGEDGVSFNCMIFVTIWYWIGYFVIISISGIQQIPVSCLESATIDGASKPQLFFRVILPLMKDTLSMAILYWIISGWMSFGVVYVMTRGGPNNMNHTMATYMMESSFNPQSGLFRMGYGTAIALTMTALVCVCALISSFLRSRREAIEF